LPTQVTNLFVFAISGWKLVRNLLQAWSFSTFHLCSKLPTCMSW